MLAVAGDQAENAAQLLAQREFEGMSDEERVAAQSVIDLEAESNSCPACMDTIPQGSARCPGCGLRIG